MASPADETLRVSKRVVKTRFSRAIGLSFVFLLVKRHALCYQPVTLTESDVAMQVSIVIPVYNEEENIAPLAAEFADVLANHDDMEVLLVDDGSSDATWEHIRKAAEHPRIRGIRTTINRGQSAAMLSGLRQASGEILVTMDGDLQNDPHDIPKLIEKMDGVDCVCGYRAKRRDSWSRRAASRLAYRIRNLVTHDGIIDTGCSLKAFRKECVEDLPPLSGVHRFMPAYFKLHGRSIEQVPVGHRPRQHGISKYTNLKRLPRTIRDLAGFAWYRNRLVHGAEIEKTDTA